MSAPALAVGGLFVEVRAAGEAQARDVPAEDVVKRRVREAMEELGAATADAHDAGGTSWWIEAVLPPIGGAGATYGVELMAPTSLPMDVHAAWELAHALATTVDGRVEPWFAGDVTPGSPVEESSSGDDGTPPVDVRWHLTQMGVERAHAALRMRGIEPGSGVRIGHPDTGYTEHPEIWAGAGGPIDLTGAGNLLEDRPPHDPQTAGFGLHPGHGTATASVIVAQPDVAVPRRDGGDAADLLGVAPAAHVVPFRVTESVVMFGWQRRLARAIEDAVKAGCGVVSISLGGLGGSRLERAIRYAEQAGTIVVAAAGNVVRFVVAPATYPLVVACAASRADRRPWGPSSRGAAVDVTAPGHQVWAAGWAGTEAVAYPGSGTSFAAAAVAGAAALWLCAHRASLQAARIPPAQRPALFRRALAQTAEKVETLPPARYGAGLLRCDALVALAIEGLDEAVVNLESPAHDDADAATFAALASLLPEDPAGLQETATAPGMSPAAASVATRVVAAVRADDFDRASLRELIFHLTIDGALRDRWSATSPASRPAIEALVPRDATRRLRRALIAFHRGAGGARTESSPGSSSAGARAAATEPAAKTATAIVTTTGGATPTVVARVRFDVMLEIAVDVVVEKAGAS